MTKILIASDIHGSEYYCKKLLERFYEEGAEYLFILGDVLYHGPRNDLPRDYAPKGVIALLNPIAEQIICIKGNCDSEVDGMVLDFPIEAEVVSLFAKGKMLYLTHGHKVRRDINKMNCVLINGHTHIPLCDESEGYLHLNPGSVSIPKENSCHSYMTFDGESFLWKNVEDGKIYMENQI